MAKTAAKPTTTIQRLARVDPRSLISEVFEGDPAALVQQWGTAFLAACIDVTDHSPAPQAGWTKNIDGTFSAPGPRVYTPAEQMNEATLKGCTITSTATPTLNATYDVRGPQWQRMKDEAWYIGQFGVFSAGITELQWKAMTGIISFSTIVEFLIVVRAIADWLSNWYAYAEGEHPSAPEALVTIP